MEQFLKDELKRIFQFDEDWTHWEYNEHLNTDAISDAWIENNNSFIYRVGVLSAIDSNKCDWVHVIIGVERSKDTKFKVIGEFHFNQGENDDIGRVMDRSFYLIKNMHPVFSVA